MTGQNHKPPAESTLANLAGGVFVFGSLLLTIVFPRLNVVVKIACVILAIGGSVWWFKFAVSTFPKLFRGKISDKALDEFLHETPTEQPTTRRAAVLNSWQVVLIALTAFCVALGFINFDSQRLNLDAGPKRFRGIVRGFLWCRGNPNTVASSSWLVGIAATSVLASRIRRAYKRSPMK